MKLAISPLRGPVKSIVDCANECEAEILGSNGEFSVDCFGSYSRKQICQFLGVAESTLSGWLQASAVPRYAAVALVLYRTIAERERQLSDSLEPFVAKIDHEYAVLRFDGGEGNPRRASVVCQGIKDETDASRIAFNESAKLRVLLVDAANNLQDLFEQEVFTQHVGDLIDDIHEAINFQSKLDGLKEDLSS